MSRKPEIIVTVGKPEIKSQFNNTAHRVSFEKVTQSRKKKAKVVGRYKSKLIFFKSNKRERVRLAKRQMNKRLRRLWQKKLDELKKLNLPEMELWK